MDELTRAVIIMTGHSEPGAGAATSGLLFASWHWRPEVVLILATLATAYASGWWRLREWGFRELARGWRLGLYLSGLGAVAVALLSSVDDLAHDLLTAHMVQPLLLQPGR